MDRLEEAVTIFVLLSRYQRFHDELIQHVENVGLGKHLVGAYSFGSVQRPSSREDGEACEEAPFLWLEKVIAPVDERLESLLPWHRRPVARREQAESIIEARRDLFQR